MPWRPEISLRRLCLKRCRRNKILLRLSLSEVVMIAAGTWVAAPSSWKERRPFPNRVQAPGTKPAGRSPCPRLRGGGQPEIGTVPFTTARSYYISAIQYHYLMGNYREGLRIAALIAAEIENIAGEISYSEHHFYHALCITAIWPGLHPERRRSGRILRKYRARFRKWSRLDAEF